MGKKEKPVSEMSEEEKESIRKELCDLDDAADKAGGYVVQTLPSDMTEKEEKMILDCIRKDKEKSQQKWMGYRQRNINWL